jgi:glutamine amidotransferase
VIALIDYKAGNLTSVRKALAAVQAEVYTPAAAAELARASAIIVPGVGHFASTRMLDDDWMRQIHELVARGTPLLGICLGMQFLFEGSDEATDCPGLGLLSGRCYRMSGGTPDARLKIPHVGWNSLRRLHAGSIAAGVDDGAQVYFTHSFVAPVTADTVAATDHGEPFAAIVQRGRVAGVQFHPEKSSDVGLRILRNFLALAA